LKKAAGWYLTSTENAALKQAALVSFDVSCDPGWVRSHLVRRRILDTTRAFISDKYTILPVFPQTKTPLVSRALLLVAYMLISASGIAALV
jgi:hypothetical protein